MEQTKRSWNNTIDNYDDNKRKKINITTVETDYSTKEYFTTNEDLSNELIYEIFEFLDDHHVFQTSFIIISIDNIKNQNDIYYKIFRLPTLKYCQLLIETLRYLRPLSIAKNEFSFIEHLVINNKISINQLNSLLSFVPQLRRLSIGYLDGYRYNRTHKNYLNADQWERLISTYMPNMRTFVFKHKFRSYYQNIDRTAYKTQIIFNTNNVKNITISKELTLDIIQLFTILFSRIQYLTINLYEEALEPIARFLLSKPNDNTRHLALLCISK
ncbi:unnamed protein product [Rotaria sordida]|uniref:F-box domain-containing protein n=1 Tax=Rotaria sordida TaxID=392033 RepID=A0A814Z9R4_9BILA|nr:unnamed protein product [Rotaria sordida]CAF1521284.1 unnamed protein product [Rotaria sordida]